MSPVALSSVQLILQLWITMPGYKIQIFLWLPKHSLFRIILPNQKEKGAELTNSMGLCPSWETARRSSTQDFPNVLRKPKVHYHAHNNPLLVHTLRLFWNWLIQFLLPHLNCVGLILPTFSLHTVISLKASPSIPCTHSTSPHGYYSYMPCPSQPPWLDSGER
jgi:hypothetical protein